MDEHDGGWGARLRLRPPQFPRSDAPELLDGLGAVECGGTPVPSPLSTQALLCANLRDIARYNVLMGTRALLLRLVREVVGFTIGVRRSSYTGLDVGTGLGDFVAYAMRADSSHWVGLDSSRPVLQCAQPVAAWPMLLGMGQSLPFADGSFDVAVCAQTLHHLAPAQAVLLLAECGRVARCGVVVVDLARGYLGVAGAWLLTRLTSRNPMTWADGVQSVRRAYTLHEAHELARLAGWPDARASSHGPIYYSLVWRKSQFPQPRVTGR